MSDHSGTRIEHDQLLVDNLRIKDPHTVATAKAAETQGIALEDFVVDALVIGVKVLQVSGVSMGLDQLSDGVDKSKAALLEATKNFGTRLSEITNETFGESGLVTKELSTKLKDFARNLEHLTGNEDSPLRIALKNQLKEFQEALSSAFEQKSESQKRAIAELLDISNPMSPMRLLGENISEFRSELGNLRSMLEIDRGRSIEAARGTSKGHTYETKVLDDVRQFALLSGDEPLATGGTPGRGTSKKGDGVVRLREGLVVKANLVIEAKDMSSAKTDLARLKYWQAQCDGARKTRGANGFLGLCKNIEDMPGGQRIIALDRLGQEVVLAYDPTQDNPQLLQLVYQVVKMHCLSVVSTGVEINPAAIHSYVEASFKQLEKFTDFHDAVKQIRKQTDKITTTANEVLDDLTHNLRALRREVAGSTSNLELATIERLAIAGTSDVDG